MFVILGIFLVYLIITRNKLEVLGKSFGDNANIYDWIFLSYLLLIYSLSISYIFKETSK